MKLISNTLFFLFILFACTANAQSETYKRAQIWLDGKPVKELAKAGIDLSEAVYKMDAYFESDFSASELTKISAAGFRVEITIEDVKKFYRDRNSSAGKNKSAVAASDCASSPTYPQPAHFYLGSMGGFFTYQQLLDNLDSMALLYPTLISMKQPINGQTTAEGRPLYYLRLSDNPTVDEPETEVLYSALHHAREPNGMAGLVYYMWYLLENYASDTSIQHLVNSTEMYFVPCVNPDGYVFNELTDPFGGGLWRKNRHDFTNGIFGVDLNRNYGNNWGYDDIGSSPDSVDATFRGNAPFSEQETQIMNAFCVSHNFKMAFNYHTYSNLLIYPWGYIENYYTPDSTQFKSYAKILTTYNHYRTGTANQTVGYFTNGSSDDWMYGEQLLKPKILAMTPEIGDAFDGFWPATTRIVELCQENMYANFMLAKLAGHYGEAKDKMPLAISSASGYLNFDFTMLGLDTTGSFTISVQPLSANFTVGSPRVFSGLNFMQQLSDSISYTVNSSIAAGDVLKYLLTVNNGLYLQSDTISKIYGTPLIAFQDDSSSISNWITQGLWNVTSSNFVSAPYSTTDSPGAFYYSNSFDELTLDLPVDLTGVAAAYVSFYAKWEIENTYDYVQLQVASTLSPNWEPLCGKYTNTGTLFQSQGNPVYDGMQLTWVKEEINLKDYIGQNLFFKFLLSSDGSAEYDGFYFDDFKIVKILPSGLGIMESKSEFSFSLFPNPASDILTLHYSIDKPANFMLYDLLGKEINSVKLSAKENLKKIDCSNLSKGVYFYHMKNENGISANHKLIIQ